MAAELVGYHATDPTSVYIGAFARVKGVTAADIAGVLYDDRSLIKVVGMRRTMFATTAEIAGVINSAVTRKIAAAERKRLLQWLAETDVAPDVTSGSTRSRHRRWRRSTSSAPRRRPSLPGASPVCASRSRSVPANMGRQGRRFDANAVPALVEARIIRGRPRGTWVSSMYEWVPMERWVPGGLAEPPNARLRLSSSRRWLRAFGPGT